MERYVARKEYTKVHHADILHPVRASLLFWVFAAEVCGDLSTERVQDALGVSPLNPPKILGLG